ncbi:MAG TPA: hypothetical protein VGX25_23555 [Actinophytocola sp.]|uniref:hypothetical protein n=1 Tax=Actinophytocola sp. TaxID=1872138 RepID=UPI002DDD85E2|nr:hypothetical protein [Actinophytocola sp.]HEV2782380.1 hypothetical protein [Actinophytocola sp.]
MPASADRARVALLIAVLVLTVGCSVHKAAGPARPPAGLRDALSFIHANDITRSYVEYSDVAAINDLARADPARFTTLRSAGLGGLVAHAQRIVSQLGIDPAGMRVRIAAGPATHGAGAWWGDYDRQRADSWFAGHATREDGGVWRAAEDYRTGPLGPVTVARTAPGQFLWANAGDALDWVAAPGRHGLAADPTIAALAACLDDVIAAVIARGDSPGLTGLGGNPAVTYAAGVRAGPATDVTEILCATGQSIGSVDYVTRVLHEAISPTGEPYSTVLPGATVLRAGSSVQVRWRPTGSTPAGRSLDMLHNREHEPIFGAA